MAEEKISIAGNIENVDIDAQMRSAYLDYAMSVIVARALPDARDGCGRWNGTAAPARGASSSAATHTGLEREGRPDRAAP